MDISSTNIRTALRTNQAASERMNGITAQLGSGSRSPRPADDPVRWGEVQRLNDSAARLQNFSDNLSRAAFSTRIASASMQSLDQQLLEMRESLDRALGSPEGSSGRQSALEQFNELHRLADDYSRPEDLNARRLLDDPGRFDSAGDLNVAAGDNNFRIRLSHQPIHLGAGGLDLPRVGEPLPSDPGSGPIIADPGNASNEEIREMGELIGAARTVLKERQAGLSADVLAVERQDDQNAALQNRFQSTSADLDAPDLEGQSALSQSVLMRSQLALFGLAGLNETRNLALQLLR
ncbi:MAG: hypothetical protein LAT55_00675 [Opitutales bacterium]|nr:hypothetical protein [Opitutales bacterium]